MPAASNMDFPSTIHLYLCPFRYRLLRLFSRLAPFCIIIIRHLFSSRLQKPRHHINDSHLASIALDNLVAAGRIRPDALDILPGLMPPMIRRVREQTGLPVLTGGLITQKAEILQALEAGALAISTTDPAVWSM